MKNFIVALNIVLVLAVGVLYYLHFNSIKKAAPVVTEKANNPGSFRIAYFEIDSLQNNYEYFKQVGKELSALEQQKTGELNSKKSAINSRYKYYQEKGQTMTQAEVAKAQQEMEELQRDYQSAEQQKMQEMDNEKFKRLQSIKKKIEDYLKEYNKDKGYSYIFANLPDLIYYKDSVNNITKDLIQGLNEQYKKKN